ncbi:acyl-CoA dehydrogenase family protein [Aquabacterium sp. J223]|uniref:acyl-CoA dehydrogenase family protein n=1 Tax=Aquabacterium sp. J223 TaxID=2898431 RepID=UPI0039171A05
MAGQDIDAFRREVRAFLAAELPQDLRRSVLQHRRLGKEEFLRWHRILHARGWAAPAWPVEHGGPGWSVLQRHVFDEECAVAGAPDVPPFGTRMLGPVLMRFGTPAQVSRFLPRILRGDDWWCQGYSEPGAGSDLASLKTRAVLDGDHFVVDGQKTWTTYAQYADWMFCLVRTDPAAKAQRGISFLLIDMRSPGVGVRPIRTLDGDVEINEVFLDRVRVPRDNLVGTLHDGWSCAKYLLTHERTGAARVGRAKRELAFLREVAAAHRVDGRALRDDPVFAHDLQRLEVEVLALEHTALRLLQASAGGGGHGAEASILKLLGGRAAQAIAEKSVEAAGALALRFRAGQFAPCRDGEPEDEDGWAAPLAGYHLNLRKISIYGGTDEVQKNIIAKAALGL